MKNRTLKHLARVCAAAGIALAVAAPAAHATLGVEPVISVTTSPAKVVAGEAVTYTVSLTPAPPGGAVFLSGDPSLLGCIAIPAVDGVATCETTAPAVSGRYYLAVLYAGFGPDFLPSLANHWLDVNAVSTTVATASPKTAAPGEAMVYKSQTTPRPTSYHYSACSGGCGAPVVETVDFAVDGTPVADCQKRPVDAETGVATCTTATAPAAGGKHVLTASYSASEDAYLTPSVGTDDFTVTTPGIALSAGALDFGSVTVGATETRAVTVTNTGTRILRLGSVTADGAYAVARGTCGATVAPGAGCELTVAFTPAGAGATAATLTVASDAGAPTVALTGTGVAAPVTTVTPPPTGASLDPKRKPTFTASVPTRGGTPSVTLPLQCPVGVACTLDGTVVISTADLAKHKRGRAAAARTQTIARFSGVRVEAGKVRSLKLKLSRAFVKQAQRRGIRVVRATLTVNTTFTDGVKVTRRQKLTIRVPKPVAMKTAAKQAPRFTG